jgi:hypothetical protein
MIRTVATRADLIAESDARREDIVEQSRPRIGFGGKKR